jgi:hypothetical protein
MVSSQSEESQPQEMFDTPRISSTWSSPSDNLSAATTLDYLTFRQYYCQWFSGISKGIPNPLRNQLSKALQLVFEISNSIDVCKVSTMDRPTLFSKYFPTMESIERVIKTFQEGVVSMRRWRKYQRIAYGSVD